MPLDYQRRLANQYARKFDKDLNESLFSNSAAAAYVPEDLKYLLEAMRPIDPKYNAKTLEAAGRIQKHMEDGFQLHFSRDYRTQGSVRTATNIKIHSDFDLLAIINRYHYQEAPVTTPFAGRLGRNRSFLLAESGINIPSDLKGITLPFFPRIKHPREAAAARAEARKLKAAIRRSCQKLKAHIQKRDGVIDYGFLPSTSLAYGYYNNFVLKVVSTLLDSGILKLGSPCEIPPACPNKKSCLAAARDPLHGMKVRDVCLTICLPSRLSANMFDHVKQLRLSENWRQVKIDAGSFRPFDFHVQAEKSNGAKLQLLDMPLTLNALNDSIRAYAGKSHLGSTEVETLLELRELRTFKRVLELLIHENPLTKDRVKIQVVDS